MFHFRQFSLEDKFSAMKVGTDAVLLGSWAQPENPGRILDIGTGCGIIALMMAQRTEAYIDAVEIDQQAAEEAHKNAKNSPWPARINIFHSSFQSFSEKSEILYDLIISNPPFFSNSLKSPDKNRNLSRHNDVLPVCVFIEGASTCLDEVGKLSVIVPAQDEFTWKTEAAKYRLFPIRSCVVMPREGKAAARVMMEFTRKAIGGETREVLFIRDAEGKYTQSYIDLTYDFYLGL